MFITQIKYADLLPGFGKTYQALTLMETHVLNGKDFMLYVGPTHNLLRQVKKDLESKIKESNPNLRIKDYLYHIDSNVSTTEIPVADEVRLRLTGTKFDDGVRVGQVKEGSILFITHAAFIGLKHKFKTRHRTRVIFDEARKCSLDDGSYTIPVEAWQLLEGSYLTFDKDKAYNTHSKVKFLTDEFNLDRFAVKAQKLGANRRQMNHLTHLLKNSNSANLELYIKLGDYRKGKQWVSLHTVLVPALMFAGFKDVLLLSAFFESSQMYHMLYRHDINNPNIPDSQKCLCLSQFKFDAGRTEPMMARYRALRITYIFDEEFTLSKSLLSRGIIIRNDNWDKKEFEDAFISWEKARDTTKAVPLRKILKLGFEKSKLLKDLPGIKDVMNLLPLSKKFSMMHPLAFMSLQASQLSDAWYKKLKEEKKPLLISCNVSGGSTEDTNRHWTKIVRPVVKDAKLVPFFCQGLNSFQTYHTLAFLAAINVKPMVKSLMESLCPGYDPHMDYALDQATQTAMRISVRDAECETRPLVIVPSRRLAVELAKHMRNLPKVIAPQKIYKKFEFKNIYQYSRVVHKNKKVERKGKDKAKVKKHVEKYLGTDKGKLAKAFQKFLIENSKPHGTRQALYVKRVRAKANGDMELVTELTNKIEALKPKLKLSSQILKPEFLKTVNIKK